MLGLAVKRGSLYDIASALEFLLRKTLSVAMTKAPQPVKPPTLQVASYVREVAAAVVEHVKGSLLEQCALHGECSSLSLD